jgi:hypothetical protein
MFVRFPWKESIALSAPLLGFSKLWFDESAKRREKIQREFANLTYFDSLQHVEAYHVKYPDLAEFIKEQKEFRRTGIPSKNEGNRNCSTSYSQYITISTTDVSKVIKFNNKGKDFFKEAKKQASCGPFSHFWITKRDFRDMIPRPHMIAYLTLVQHYDKVNCNGTNLLLRDKSGPSSWAHPNSCRPSIYDWVENTWDIKCENVYAGDLGEPVCI